MFLHFLAFLIFSPLSLVFELSCSWTTMNERLNLSHWNTLYTTMTCFCYFTDDTKSVHELHTAAGKLIHTLCVYMFIILIKIVHSPVLIWLLHIKGSEGCGKTMCIPRSLPHSWSPWRQPCDPSEPSTWQTFVFELKPCPQRRCQSQALLFKLQQSKKISM